MIDLNDLSHTATIKRKYESSERDTYTGRKRNSEKEIVVRCFFDSQMRKFRLNETRKSISISGILFLAPDSDVQENDIVSSITDSGGNVLMPDAMRIEAVSRLNEPSGVHHLEVALVKDASS